MKNEDLKTLLIRLTPELHKQMRHISIDTGISLNEYVIEAFKIFKDKFKRIIIVTNQQGVGKGIMTNSDVEKVHRYMIQEIEQQGGKVDAVYFCPQLKSVHDNYRKPSPKMAYFAKNDFPDIDLSKSIMVGDMKSDVEFGKNAGMKTVFVGDNELTITPDDKFETLYYFAKSL